MTRILLVETAFPQRVRMRAEAILSGRVYPSPELTILCSDDLRTAHYLGEIAGAEGPGLHGQDPLCRQA